MVTKNVLKEHLKAYLKADKLGKGELLDSLVVSLKMHRKAVIRKLRKLQLKDVGVKNGRGRKTYYGNDCTVALKELWVIGGEICAERLQPEISEYIEILERDKMWNYDDVVTGKLRAMSVGTMKKRIAKFLKVLNNRKGLSATKPSSLKEIIPIRRSAWKDTKPGMGEIDTVAHCGDTLEGTFAYSVQYTDIETIWCGLEAQMSKGKIATVKSMVDMMGRFPFDTSLLDPDTGGEFINWHMYDTCQERGITLTRIRPGVSNDHGHIEQKNNTNIRKYAGYIRIDENNRLLILQELYVHLELYINHFTSSMKCIEKIRHNISHSSRKYDVAKTPYKRMLEHPLITEEHKIKQREIHAKLNPKTLQEIIKKLREKLFKDAKFTKKC